MLSRVGSVVVWLMFGLWINVSLAYAGGEDGVYVRVDAASVSWDVPHTWATIWNAGTYSQQQRYQQPQIRLLGTGEAYLGQVYRRGREQVWLLLRVPRPQEVHGILWVPEPRGQNRMRRVGFRVTLGQAKAGASVQARRLFYAAKEAHYRKLWSLHIPGTSWFRWQMEQARMAYRQIAPTSQSTTLPTRRQYRGDFSHTMAFFSGGLAVGENLQLDALLPDPKGTGDMVSLQQIRGIRTTAFDFAQAVKGKIVGIDPLARIIPVDQYALFFPSLEVMLHGSRSLVAYLSNMVGWSAVQGLSGTWVNRYQTQLCLASSMLSEFSSKQAIKSVALTGSDPYFLLGTDVAVLFDTTKPEPLVANILACQTKALRTFSYARRVGGQLAGITYQGVISADRRISSYVMVVGKVMVVANSLVPLHRVARVFAKQEQAMSQLHEYQFFRLRYPLGYAGETALLMLTDATIRRWGSPKWRIGTSRRHRIAAILAALKARELDGKRLSVSQIPWQVPGSGEWIAASDGYRSAVYGSLSFLTPVAELDFSTVTSEEAGLYRLWRQDYERRWQGMFDPIAFRFSQQQTKWEADLSVIPLIGNSIYQGWSQLFQGPHLRANDGDPERLNVAHVSFSLAPQSMLLRWVDMWTGRHTGFAFSSWVGRYVSLVLLPGKFWEAWALSSRPTKFWEKNLRSLPAVLMVAIRDPSKCQQFWDAIQRASSRYQYYSVWSTHKFHEYTYVKVAPHPVDKGKTAYFRPTLYYAVTPRLLLLTFSLDALKVSLHRLSRSAGSASSQPVPFHRWRKKGRSTSRPIRRYVEIRRGKPEWPGKHVRMFWSREWIQWLWMASRRNRLDILQRQSWANLMILNEWKRRFPQEDPVAFHQKHWLQTLRCPTGGVYRWNPDWHTMESSVLGHPMQPKHPYLPVSWVQKVDSILIGFSFAMGGLRTQITWQHLP